MKIITIFVLVLSLLFLFGCGKSPEQIKAEEKALQWVYSKATEVFKPFSANFTLNIEDTFYILKSSKFNDGFCVEIASKERIPPKYKQQLSFITTLPLFVNKQKQIDEFDVQCFNKAYPDNRGKVVSLMNIKLNETTYSALRFFLIREVGNALSKTKLKKMGYKPNYDLNFAAEYFTDTLLLETSKDQKFKKTHGIYVETEFNINGEKMIENYVNSIQ